MRIFKLLRIVLLRVLRCVLGIRIIAGGRGYLESSVGFHITCIGLDFVVGNSKQYNVREMLPD